MTMSTLASDSDSEALNNAMDNVLKKIVTGNPLGFASSDSEDSDNTIVVAPPKRMKRMNGMQKTTKQVSASINNCSSTKEGTAQDRSTNSSENNKKEAFQPVEWDTTTGIDQCSALE